MKNLRSKFRMVLVCLGMCMVIGMPALASSYNSTLSMSTDCWQFSGSTRKYSGKSIKMSMSLKRKVTQAGGNQVYLRASLYRKNLIFSDYVSYHNYDDFSGKETHKWVNVGSGKYYWSFEKKMPKNHDYYKYFVAFNSKNVKMYNY